MVGGLVADNVYHRRIRPSRIVYVGDPVGKTRSAVEQRHGRFPGHRRSRRPVTTASAIPSTQRMPSTLSRATTNGIRVPGLAKQISTSEAMRVRIRLSAPVMLASLSGGLKAMSFLCPRQAETRFSSVIFIKVLGCPLKSIGRTCISSGERQYFREILFLGLSHLRCETPPLRENT